MYIDYIYIYYKDIKFNILVKYKKNEILISGYDVNFDLNIEDIYKISSDRKLNLDLIIKKLLLDYISQNYKINTNEYDFDDKFKIVDVWLKDGVTDCVGETIKDSLNIFGFIILILVLIQVLDIFLKIYIIKIF